MNNTFSSQFLMISDIRTIIFILLLIFSIIIINKLKKIYKFNQLIIIAIIIGLLIGIIIQVIGKFPDKPQEVVWIKQVVKWYGLIGYGFMDLLKMLIVPLIFVSIIKVIINLQQSNDLKKLTFRTISMLLITTATAAIIGIIIGNIFMLGVGMSISETNTTMRDITPIVDTLINLLPSNIIETMAKGNIVGIVIFSTFIGLAIQRLNKKYTDLIKPYKDFIEAFYKIMVSISISIIKLMPYAVIPLISNTIAQNGLSAVLSVVKFILALYTSVLIMFIIHLIIIYLNGIKPKKYINDAFDPLLLAFTSRSSLGTLPLTIEVLIDKMRIESGTASFVGSIGSNMGMNGCAGIYPALMAVTIANMVNIPMTFSFYVMLVIVITIGSLGIAGLPGSATMAVSVVISGMGMGAYFPLVGDILAIDPILDMARTMINVNGTMTTAVVVAKSLGKIEKKN